MKKLMFLLLPVFALAQQKVSMEFNTSLKDASHAFGKAMVIDVRPNKNLGTYTDKNGTHEFILQDGYNSAIESRFDKDNKVKGTKKIILLLENLEVFNGIAGKKEVPDARIVASTFEERDGKYYYITGINKNVGSPDLQAGKSVKLLEWYVSQQITDLMKASYTKQPSALPLAGEQLPNYRRVLSESMPAFTSELKDGVYESANAFFGQTPSQGYILERNSEGKVIRAKNGSEKLPNNKIYAYVENGKPYLNTYSGFLPLEKNDKGYYLISNRGELEAVAYNSTYGMFGLVGGIAGAVDQNAKQNKAKKEEKKEVYIDPLTGSYIY